MDYPGKNLLICIARSQLNICVAWVMNLTFLCLNSLISKYR